MVITVIDEVKNSDSSTDVNDSIEDVSDFVVTASAATAVNSLELSSAEIADREIKIWKSHRSLSQGQESSRRVASWCCASFPLVGCLGEACTVIPATSAGPERLFSTAGNVMTQKHSRLTCDNMQDLVCLHKVWP